MTKWVYSFGGGAAEGRADMKDLLGGKGANLAEMSSLGLPVPPGFTITTEVCTHYYKQKRSYPAELEAEVAAALAAVEKALGARLGDPQNPLLVSVRSGARASMPGMMDTVLNLGLNDETVAGLAKISGDARFAWDSYRRFLQMYGEVVLGLDHQHFSSLLDDYKNDIGASLDTELKAEDWQTIAEGFKEIVAQETGKPFPQDAQGAALGRHRRRIRQLDEPARDHLPPAQQHPRRAGAPRSTCRRWCSAIWATIAPPASPSPATRPPARTSSMANSWSMRRARTSWPASARRSI